MFVNNATTTVLTASEINSNYKGILTLLTTTDFKGVKL